jgi:hypothetical protein
MIVLSLARGELGLQVIVLGGGEVEEVGALLERTCATDGVDELDCIRQFTDTNVVNMR